MGRVRKAGPATAIAGPLYPAVIWRRALCPAPHDAL